MKQFTYNVCKSSNYDSLPTKEPFPPLTLLPNIPKHQYNIKEPWKSPKSLIPDSKTSYLLNKNAHFRILSIARHSSMHLQSLKNGEGKAGKSQIRGEAIVGNTARRCLKNKEENF